MWASESFDSYTFTYEDLTLTFNATPVALTGRVTTYWVSDTTYRIAGLASSTSVEEPATGDHQFAYLLQLRSPGSYSPAREHHQQLATMATASASSSGFNSE